MKKINKIDVQILRSAKKIWKFLYKSSTLTTWENQMFLCSYKVEIVPAQEPKEEFLEDHNQNGLTSEGEFIQTQNVQEEVYTETDELPRSETVYTKEENELSEHSSSTLSVPMQDYYEIQVAEEEVVCDNWNVAQNE